MNRRKTEAITKYLEGFVPIANHGPRGFLQIGYGTRIDRGHGISKRVAALAVTDHYDTILPQLRERIRFFDYLDDVRQAILCDMAYNMGMKGLLGFSNMLASAQAGDWPSMRDELVDSNWHKQVGRRALMLEEMSLTGQWPKEVKA